MALLINKAIFTDGPAKDFETKDVNVVNSLALEIFVSNRDQTVAYTKNEIDRISNAVPKERAEKLVQENFVKVSYKRAGTSGGARYFTQVK